VFHRSKKTGSGDARIWRRTVPENCAAMFTGYPDAHIVRRIFP
jgi:hypothetical protein